MRRSPLVALLMAGALALAACGDDDEADTAGGEGGATTGPGVTADTITLGVMTDLSGPFKDYSTTLQAGHELWVQDVNAAGGICGRQVKLLTKDHGYQAEQAKVFFPDMTPNVAGYLELLGSPINAALKEDVEESGATVLAISWSSFLLDRPELIIVGATYDLEIINGLSYFLDEGLISRGDTIGHIYIEGEYGGNALLGSQYMADQHNLTLVEESITSTDTDMRGIVTKFEGDGVDAIVLTTSPSQTASAATANQALGLNVPMLGSNPVFYPTLLDTPAANDLEKLYISASAVPYAADVPKAKEIAKAYKAGYDAPPAFTVPYGYSNGLIWQQILETTCDDLSREGILAAKQASGAIDTAGLTAPLDFAQAGQPSGREVYVAKVNEGTPGGMKQQTDLFASEDAMAYTVPGQQ